MRHPRELTNDELHMIARRTRTLMRGYGITEADIAKIASQRSGLLNAMLRATYTAVREQLEAERPPEGSSRPQ